MVNRLGRGIIWAHANRADGSHGLPIKSSQSPMRTANKAMGVSLRLFIDYIISLFSIAADSHGVVTIYRLWKVEYSFLIYQLDFSIAFQTLLQNINM